VPGILTVSVCDHVKEITEAFPHPESIENSAAAPAAEHPFEVNEKARKLDEASAQVFHNVAAKGSFVTKRARPDVVPAIAFLTARVKEPDEDDWKKLIGLLKCSQGTKEMAMHLSAESLHRFRTLTDASFAVHPDMKSHTGGNLTLGKGAIVSVCAGQKLNTRSSTEAELVGVDDCMCKVLWPRYFMEAQGYPPEDVVIYQDNKSAILLEENGRASIGRRTRFIKLRYFFVTDRIKAGEVRVEYCPTKEMVSDFLTKPLQGQLFYKLRSLLMNCDPKE